MLIHEQKNSIRISMRQQRLQLSHTVLASATKLAELLDAWYLIRYHKTISGYLPINAEIDPTIFLQKVRSNGTNVLLPATSSTSKVLTFRIWDQDAILRPTAWGGLEPSDDSSQSHPTLMLLPLLAFDQKGYRLGYGQGWYDRTLINLKSSGRRVVAVGLAFDYQRLESIPCESHDQKLDYVVTPTTIYEYT